MEEKSMWIGFGLGLIASSFIFSIAVINNNYADSLPKALFAPTSAIVPYYINLNSIILIVIIIGSVISASFLISQYCKLYTKDDDV